MNYRYQLDKSSKKFHCPRCKKKTFVKYLDHQENEYLPEYVGKCDREINCKYHLTAKVFLQSNGQTYTPSTNKAPIKPPPKQTSYIPMNLVQSTLKAYEQNNFVIYLKKLFGEKQAMDLVQTFKIGTSKYWEGASIFWQFDRLNKVRTGKIMLYQTTGKRVKEPFNHFSWVHFLLSKKAEKTFHLNQCLFGEFQLQTEASTKPIAIVESEKTAILMTPIMPELTWLATGGLSNLKPSNLKALKYRNIILYPDLNAFNKWEQKANELQKMGFQIKVSTLLKEQATPEQKKQGWDLADYFIHA